MAYSVQLSSCPPATGQLAFGRWGGLNFAVTFDEKARKRQPWPVRLRTLYPVLLHATRLPLPLPLCVRVFAVRVDVLEVRITRKRAPLLGVLCVRVCAFVICVVLMFLLLCSCTTCDMTRPQLLLRTAVHCTMQSVVLPLLSVDTKINGIMHTP